jgi:AcrR family transcriptional regulator
MTELAAYAAYAAYWEAGSVMDGILRRVAQTTKRRNPGRPRADEVTGETREEILDAAAVLFIKKGLGGTTTRHIAERAGIRQATMYHYFAAKADILLELLERTVRPSLEAGRRIWQWMLDGGDPAAALYALALSDVNMLRTAPHNIATLYILPEVRADEHYTRFRALRDELQSMYGDLGAQVTSLPGIDEELAGALVMQLVESVIPLRQDGDVGPKAARIIAKGCLRVLGLDPAAIAAAVAAAPSEESLTEGSEN